MSTQNRSLFLNPHTLSQEEKPKMKKVSTILAILMIAAMLLSACGGTATTQAPTVAPTEKPAEPMATEKPAEAAPTEVPATEAPKFKACQVTDTGGIDDKSFNATAWKGFEDAAKEFGVEIKYLESQSQTDYEKNINAFIQEKCDLIITVGFLLADATKAAAEANPDQKFAIIDQTYDPAIPNVRGSAYAVDQSGFLNGYLAASQTKTGKVATYGGIQFPAVTAFMDGFAAGVQHYNQVKGANVEVLGWDPTTQTGLFAGNFDSTDDGRRLGESLLDEGADIIMPVAGPVGEGTLAVLKERGTGMLVGVDTDWSVKYPDDAQYILSSVLKNMDVFVKDTVEKAMDGTFQGENYLGTLENAGVGIGISSAWKDKIPAETLAEVEQLQNDIISGKLSAAPIKIAAPEGFKACQVTDTGGIDDKSFNATAWKGFQDAQALYGGEIKYLESQSQTDYEKNINAFIQEKCNLIVTVGFLLADATKAAAEANPSQHFAIIDQTYDPVIPNVRGSAYAVNESGFLNGYLAAGITKTGKVATYGGIQFPAVTAFMDGYAMGVKAYNEKHGTAVEVLGWDPATQTGLFAGNFDSTDDGRRLGESLLDEGADIIMPVAGPVGEGTLAVLKERGTGLLIGVDTDWSVKYPDDAQYILSSVLKNMDAFVQNTYRAEIEGKFVGENYLGTLKNGGVGIGISSAWKDKIPADLMAELAELTKGIIAGTVQTMPTTQQ
jgi:basic membrane protein A and related proteins